MNQPQKEMSLQEVHEATLDILDKYIEICENNSFHYFIVYGSLIGVIRHKGFIPWDDDLDVGMLREDFERFCVYCHEHEAEIYPFKLMDNKNTPGYRYNIPRLCDLRYHLKSDAAIPDVGMGAFIDIYPFDGFGNSPSQNDVKKIELKKKFILSAIDYKIKNSFTPSKKGGLITIVRYGIYLWSKMHDLNYFFEKLNSLRKNYPDIGHSKYVASVVWNVKTNPIDKEWVESTIFDSFEGRNVRIPSGYDKMLKATYGDYMELPSEEKRVPHHEYKLYRRTENSD